MTCGPSTSGPSGGPSLRPGAGCDPRATLPRRGRNGLRDGRLRGVPQGAPGPREPQRPVDLRSLRGDWELVQPADGVSPTPRGAAAAAADPLRPVMYVFGGAACHGGCQCTSDLWQFSRATNTWKEIKPPGPQPTNRHFHSLSVSPDRVLYVFGGESYDPYMYFNDVWKFDLKPLDPRDASPSKALPSAPPPLNSPVSFGTIPGYPLLQPRSDSQVMLLKILLGGVVVAFFSTAVKSLLHRGPDRRSPGGAAGPSPAAPTVGVPPKPKTQ
eukprot:TRINITY_DN9338_c0_g1_i1.p2 TRINITY_DN9338_c0_g1~~TRINITY_DN9338_c0_g1_i1.p2  ORF type:complete len:270 (+),score=48.52 TRINITY_DN9338_c0_g1_i1:597-1406(+)